MTDLFIELIEAPLEFVRTLSDKELKENQTATFECELNKANVPVTWYRNGEPLKNDKDIAIQVAGHVHKLVLKNCDPNCAAKYTVKTSGPSSSALLYIEEIPVEFTQKLNNVTVKEKETATFACQINKVDAQVQWYKDGTELRPNTDKYKFVCDGAKYSLQIFDCQLEDISDYSISLRGRKCSGHLNVEELPAGLLRPLTDVSVYEKQEIVLECEFDRPNVDALWLKDNVEVKYALGLDRFSKKVTGTVYKLTVYESLLEDAGSYSCVVKQTKTSCQVKVSEKPVEVMKMLEDQEVVENQTATFVCTLSKPRLNVTWYKNGDLLPENDKYQYVKEGKVYKLVIRLAKLDDKAKYTIKYADEAESSAQLIVKGKFKLSGHFLENF